MVARTYEGAASMTQRDQELLDKQFLWLNRSRAKGFLVFSVASAILIFVLGSASIA
jgi:hypothetical protein